MRILILDDQPHLAYTLALSLRLAGYSAKSFTSATEALANMREADVLVTDYHMPEMTGLEVARRAYAQGWRGALLLMSGHPGQIKEAIEHPLLHLILNKPFSTQELVKALPKSCDRPTDPVILAADSVSEPHSPASDPPKENKFCAKLVSRPVGRKRGKMPKSP